MFNLRKRIAALLAAIVFLAAFLYAENNLVTFKQLTIDLDSLPAAFSGLKIVHLSDLHGKYFGKDQQILVDKINKIRPDLIVFTGDLIDRRRGGTKAGLKLLGRLATIAPVYYVTGNHEGWTGDFDTLLSQLKNSDVKVLSNAHDQLRRDKDSIYIVGIDDPTLKPSPYGPTKQVRNDLETALEGTDGFTILLAHRPELIDIYSSFGVNLVFSGHAHGGQIRLPFVGGLIAPGQGFFPQYTSGLYTQGSSILVVSQGLGNSLFPQRLFNRPEIVVITLNKS